MDDVVFILSNAVVVACIYGLVAIAVSITWSMARCVAASSSPSD